MKIGCHCSIKIAKFLLLKLSCQTRELPNSITEKMIKCSRKCIQHQFLLSSRNSIIWARLTRFRRIFLASSMTAESTLRTMNRFKSICNSTFRLESSSVQSQGVRNPSRRSSIGSNIWLVTSKLTQRRLSASSLGAIKRLRIENSWSLTLAFTLESTDTNVTIKDVTKLTSPETT